MEHLPPDTVEKLTRMRKLLRTPRTLPAKLEERPTSAPLLQQAETILREES